ncbi:MAG: diadenylate cyclase [Clostridia bacterium]|nr:diadenylate cyclase [Clostridia bacterium]
MQGITEFWNTLVESFNDYVIFPIKSIGIVDVIDIALLACLLYMIFKFIRDRHVGRIMLGLGAIVLIYILSDVFNMIAIGSILKNFYVVGIMVVCVIFQPELRAVLEEVGSTSLNLRKIKNRKDGANSEMLGMVEEISAAAFELSARGDGALIVIERSSRLRSQMTEGVALDAKVSRQLLSNIFFNKSPLHDGAVIIRDMKIVAASSKSKSISESDDAQMRRLGTRHRAALRITEISDAIVVVVSEETGNISIVNNKILNRGYQDIGKNGKHKSNDLRDDLYKLMTGNSVNEDVYLSVNVDKAVAGDDKIDIVNAEGIDIDDSMEKEDTDSV